MVKGHGLSSLTTCCRSGRPQQRHVAGGGQRLRHQPAEGGSGFTDPGRPPGMNGLLRLHCPNRMERCRNGLVISRSRRNDAQSPTFEYNTATIGDQVLSIICHSSGGRRLFLGGGGATARSTRYYLNNLNYYFAIDLHRRYIFRDRQVSDTGDESVYTPLRMKISPSGLSY